MIELIYISAYAILSLIIFGILYYYEVDKDEFICASIAVMWPVMIVVVVAVAPFYLVKILVVRLKKVKNAKKMDFSNLCVKGNGA